MRGPRPDRRPDRRRAERAGRRAEWIAAAFLTLKGYRIVAMRHRANGGEVDIVARRGSLAVMVEVKRRATAEAALMAVTREAQERIEAAGLAWLARQRDGARLATRNDIVAVVPWRLPVHYEDVW